MEILKMGEETMKERQINDCKMVELLYHVLGVVKNMCSLDSVRKTKLDENNV